MLRTEASTTLSGEKRDMIRKDILSDVFFLSSRPKMLIEGLKNVSTHRIEVIGGIVSCSELNFRSWDYRSDIFLGFSNIQNGNCTSTSSLSVVKDYLSITK